MVQEKYIGTHRHWKHGYESSRSLYNNKSCFLLVSTAAPNRQEKSKECMYNVLHATERSRHIKHSYIIPRSRMSHINHQCLYLLPSETIGVILRRRLTSQRFIVHPGIVHWDSKEEIKFTVLTNGVAMNRLVDTGDDVIFLSQYPTIQIGHFRRFTANLQELINYNEYQ